MRPRRGRSSQAAVTTAFIGGVVAGLVVWSMQLRRCRRDLFSSSVLRRFAALGYLGGHPGAETAQLLAEYARWERQPVLRRKAQRLLGRMQRQLT